MLTDRQTDGQTLPSALSPCFAKAMRLIIMFKVNTLARKAFNPKAVITALDVALTYAIVICLFVSSDWAFLFV